MFWLLAYEWIWYLHIYLHDMNGSTTFLCFIFHLLLGKYALPRLHQKTPTKLRGSRRIDVFCQILRSPPKASRIHWRHCMKTGKLGICFFNLLVTSILWITWFNSNSLLTPDLNIPTMNYPPCRLYSISTKIRVPQITPLKSLIDSLKQGPLGVPWWVHLKKWCFGKLSPADLLSWSSFVPGKR